jgi:hypothetical protein
MINPPRTKAEAAKVRYGSCAGYFGGAVYQASRCAYEINDGWYYWQCRRKPTKGPDNLYCGIHAKKVKE